MNYFIGKIFYGIVWLILTIIQALLFYIDICDVALTTLLIVAVMNVNFGWNNWWGLALGLTVSLAVYIIFKHRIGFWVVSPVFSYMWAWIGIRLVTAAFEITLPRLWYWLLMAGCFLCVLWLHSYARDRKLVHEELAAEEAAKSRR